MIKENRITIVLVPSSGSEAFIQTIDNELEPFQQAVGGFVETLRTDIDGVIALINEDGKYICRPNFPVSVLTQYGMPGDIIFGPVVFALDIGDEEFHSLTDDAIDALKTRLDWLNFVDRRIL